MEKETTTKSVKLCLMRRVRPEFLEMIKRKMDAENLGIRELARKLGVSHPTVTEIVTYGNMPSFDTNNALSDWLGIPKELGLRKSGLLKSSDNKNDDWIEEMSHKMKMLSPANRTIAEKLLNALIEEPQPAAKTQKARA